MIFLNCIDFYTVWRTADSVKRFLVYRKNYQKILYWKRKVHSTTKNSNGNRNMNFLAPIEIFVYRWLPYRVAFNGRHKLFLVHCKHFHIAVCSNRKIQSQTKNWSRDSSTNLIFLSPIEFFVLHSLSSSSSKSWRQLNCVVAQRAISYGTRSKVNNSISDKNAYLNVLSSIEFFVLRCLLNCGVYRELHKTFTGLP